MTPPVKPILPQVGKVPELVSPTPPILTDPPVPPPTNVPPVPGLTDEQKLKLYEIQEKALKEQGRKLSELTNHVAELKGRNPEPTPIPTPVSADESAKEFFKDPEARFQKQEERFSAMLAEAVKPLNDANRQSGAQTAYDNLKNILRVDPRFSAYFNYPAFVAELDEAIDGALRSNIPLSEALVEASVRHTIGRVYTRELVLQAPVVPNAPVNPTAPVAPINPAQPDPSSIIIPPYLSPSSPAGPTKPKPVLRELTENEEVLRKRRGMSKEEWLDWQDIDSKEVVDSKIGLEIK